MIYKFCVYSYGLLLTSPSFNFLLQLNVSYNEVLKESSFFFICLNNLFQTLFVSFSFSGTKEMRLVSLKENVV